MSEQLQLSQINIEGDTQSREKINEDVVAEYAELMQDGVVFPAVEVYHDGTTYWLADGFHRVLAAADADIDAVAANVTKGTREAARWYALRANRKHGLRRTNEDKHICIERAIEMKPDMSDRAIAQHCGVANSTVSRYRKRISGEEVTPENVKECGKATPAEVAPVSDELQNTPAVSPEPLEPVTELYQEPETADVDTLGNKLPDRESCKLAFGGAIEIDEILNQLRDIAATITQAEADDSPAFVHVKLTPIKAQLENVYQAFAAGRPYAVCKVCGGKKDDCRACKGHGFVGKQVYDIE